MRTSIRTLVLTAGLMAPATALAQPASTDLGTLAMDGTPITTAAFNIAANEVVWFKFTINTPVRYQDLKWLDILTLTAGDTEVSLWDPSGNFIRSDDDDGPGLASQLSFGTGEGTIPSGTTPSASNGRDGDLVLASGTYYIGVTYFNVTWGTTNWTVVTPGNTAITGAQFRLNGGNTPAVTDPAGTIDLGTVSYGTPVTNSAGALSSSQRVQWYKVTLPEGNAASGSYIDMDTEGTLLTTSNTTRLTLFNAAGAQAARTDGTGSTLFTDLVDGSGSLSQLTFGATTPARPAVGTGLAYNGRDGAIRAGRYYINVMGTGSTPTQGSTTLSVNFGITSTSTNFGPVTLRISAALPATNPTGTVSVTPGTVGVTESAAVRVTVTPGQNPTSSNLQVNLDGTLVGDVNPINLKDDGNAPDLVAGDNIFSGTVTVAPATPLATYPLPYAITDDEARVTNGTASLTVAGPTNPSGAGTSNPLFGSEGDSTTLRVTVTPGLRPASTGLGVSVDASSINAGTVTLLDNGVAPDVTAGDNIFSASATVGMGTTAGAKTLPFTITDGEARTGTGNINYAVVGPAPACPTGGVDNLSSTGLPSEGTVGAVANGVGNYAPTSSAIIGSVKINGRFVPNTSFTAESRIRVTAPNGQQVVVTPFTTSGPAGVPVDMVEQTVTFSCPVAANAGTWEVRTYESLNDSAVPDGVWANLCVALVEAAPADPAVWTDDACVADAGDLPGTAQVISGCGPLNSIRGNFAASDIDMYKLRISNPAAFSASTAPGTTDTQIFLFGLDGKGVLFNDDTATGSAHSTLTNAGGQITTAGDYYLAVGVYNRDPVDSTSALLWLNSPFTGNRIPDGAGAANAINGWVNTTTTTGAYTITLAGTSKVSPAGCNRADVTEIGGTSEAPGCPDGQLTVDDVIVFVNTFSDSLGCPGANAPNGPSCNLADITDIGDTGFGPDAQLTVDDIIAFFNSFSDGCL